MSPFPDTAFQKQNLTQQETTRVCTWWGPAALFCISTTRTPPWGLFSGLATLTVQGRTHHQLRARNMHTAGQGWFFGISEQNQIFPPDLSHFILWYHVPSAFLFCILLPTLITMVTIAPKHKNDWNKPQRVKLCLFFPWNCQIWRTAYLYFSAYSEADKLWTWKLVLAILYI